MLRLFVPVYNEEKRISQNINVIVGALSKLGREYRLVLVDDSSSDKSLEIIKGGAKSNPNIIVREFSNGPSRRENLAEAMLDSGDGDTVCFMDVDLSSDLTKLPDLIRLVESGYDIAIGSRYLSKKPKRRLGRLLISRAYNLAIRLLFSSRVRDHQCGFKAFRGNVIKRLIREAGFDSSFRRGWFWDAEILLRAQKDGYQITELGLGWAEGSTSSFSLSRELKIVAYMLRFWLVTGAI
jgi:glycosyltransferase AglD